MVDACALTTSTAWPIRWGICSTLREKTGPDCYITVEKILAKGEQLPADWPVSGTTGYEFIASLAEVAGRRR